MDESEIYSKRLNVKEVIFSHRKRLIFPVADGRMQPFGGDLELRTFTLMLEHPIRGASHVDVLGESEGLFHHLTTQFPDAGVAINDF